MSSYNGGQIAFVSFVLSDDPADLLDANGLIF